jgi:drug/metabolite transporter (DMT)-like permease
MSGVALAITAGVGFGIFQAVNRRANQGIDAYRATFGLLMIGTIGLTIVSLTTQDLSLVTTAPTSAILHFAAAGIVHFFFGWTFLSLSQQRDGAARTGATAGATPLVGSILAAVALGEGFGWVVAAGVVLVVSGVVTLSFRGGAPGVSMLRSVPWFGLLAASSWGTSPLFIRWGLEGLPAPLLGVTVGMAGATLAYAVALTVTKRWKGESIHRSNLLWLAAAGVLVAVSIASQWSSYDLIPIAVAITLMQLSAPVVIVTAPLIIGTHLEKITPSLLVGTALVMAGSILVIQAA